MPVVYSPNTVIAPRLPAAIAIRSEETLPRPWNSGS